mgnify:CR=1 FL=1
MKRNCPICNREIICKTKWYFNDSNKKNRLCRKCFAVGENNSNFGNKYSDESKLKISNGNKGKLIGGKNPTKRLDVRQKISEKLKGRKLSDYIINKISNSKRGINLSENHKEKISISQIKRYNNIKEKLKTSISVKKAMHRDDVRKKHLDALHHSEWIKVRTDKGQLELLEKWNRLGFNFIPNYQIKTDLDLFYLDGYDKEKNIIIEYDTKYHNKPSQKQKDLVRQQKIIDILGPKKFWRYDSINEQCINILER